MARRPGSTRPSEGQLKRSFIYVKAMDDWRVVLLTAKNGDEIVKLTNRALAEG